MENMLVEAPYHKIYTLEFEKVNVENKAFSSHSDQILAFDQRSHYQSQVFIEDNSPFSLLAKKKKTAKVCF